MLNSINQEKLLLDFWESVKRENQSFADLYSKIISDLSIQRSVERNKDFFCCSCCYCCGASYIDQNSRDGLHHINMMFVDSNGKSVTDHPVGLGIGYVIRDSYRKYKFHDRKIYGNVATIRVNIISTIRICCTTEYINDLDIKKIATEQFNNREIEGCFLQNVMPNSSKGHRKIGDLHVFQCCSYTILIIFAILSISMFAAGMIKSGIFCIINLICGLFVYSLRYQDIMHQIERTGLKRQYQRAYIYPLYVVAQGIKEQLLQPEVEKIKHLAEVLQGCLGKKMPIELLNIIISYMVQDYHIVKRALPNANKHQLLNNSSPKQITHHYTKYQSIPLSEQAAEENETELSSSVKMYGKNSLIIDL